MLKVNAQISIPFKEIDIQTSRSGGPGGQHANKVETTIILNFDILSSTLPKEIKVSLLRVSDSRLSKKGVLRIKSNSYKSQKKNLEAAYLRLKEFIIIHSRKKKKRIKTKPTKQSKELRLSDKKLKGQLKNSRKKIKI